MSTSKKLSRVKKIILATTIGLFIVSLTQVSFCANGGCSGALMTFLVGWLGVFCGGANLVWTANIFLFLTCFFLIKNIYNYAIISGALALLISLSFLGFKEIVVNEGGSPSTIDGYGTGYWLWTSSCAVALLGAILLAYKTNNK